jgi:type III pantothenate kinase
MILTVDIGNSSIAFGLFADEPSAPEGQLLAHSKVATDTAKTADEYAVLLQALLSIHGHTPDEVCGVAISSVVPQLTHVLECAVRTPTPAPQIAVGPGVRTGFSIRIDDPSQLGADLAANAAAAIRYYGAPVLIADLGTVNSLSLVDGNRAYLGAVLFPGVRTSLEGMRASTAQLPVVSLTAPRGTLGKNTADAIRSGILRGAALQLDGFIDRLLEEFHLPANTPVVATGGAAPLLLPACRHAITVDPHLTLRGLFCIWKLNETARKS